MNVANHISTRSALLSNGCRVASFEGASFETTRTPTTAKSAATRAYHASVTGASPGPRARPSALAFGATAAGAACVMCHSVRLTAACSASSALNSALHRHATLSCSTSSNATVRNHSHRQHFGNGTSSTVVKGSHGPIVPCSQNLPRTTMVAVHKPATCALTGAVHSSANIGPHFILSEAFGGVLGNLSATTSITAQGALEGPYDGTNSGWTMKELAGAIVFASAASAGSLFLGPFDKLRGNGENGPGGGGGPAGNNNGGGDGGGGGYKSAFASSIKEQDEVEAKTAAGIAGASKPYEVSVRALRGGRLSMEDEFIVAGGGRLSAVFDGHGGGGVSQHLRDRLYAVLSEQLSRQDESRAIGNSLRGDLKGLMFGKKLTGNTLRNQRSGGINNTGANKQPSGVSSSNYDLSQVGQLPVSVVVTAMREAFDQIDKEVLMSDEFEYQGSTAVAVLLHEGDDGARTLLSANIGDSRAILSRNGRAIDLTRDHKPNDDKEKARILAMGEKIEWDHYCKVHRVRNLSLSRAIGDRFAKPAVSGEVEIQCFPSYDKDEFILLASDGLWDVMSSQEAVAYVHKRLDAAPKDGANISCDEDLMNLKYLRRKNMSRFIANEALRRGSGDNISVVIVWLDDVDYALST